MKRLFLPVTLITFAVICLTIVHMNNLNEIETTEKVSLEMDLKDKEINKDSSSYITDL